MRKCIWGSLSTCICDTKCVYACACWSTQTLTCTSRTMCVWATNYVYCASAAAHPNKHMNIQYTSCEPRSMCITHELFVPACACWSTKMYAMFVANYFNEPWTVCAYVCMPINTNTSLNIVWFKMYVYEPRLMRMWAANYVYAPRTVFVSMCMRNTDTSINIMWSTISHMQEHTVRGSHT